MRLSQKIRRFAFPLSRRVNQWIRPDVWSGGPPAGLFSEQLQLRNSAIEGKILQGGPELPEIPVDSEIHAAHLDQDKHGDWVTLWSRRDDAFLAGPSLAHIDAASKVCLEAVYGPHAWSDPVWRRKKPTAIRELSGDYTSIVSRWNQGKNYYHWFLDGLIRLVHLPNFPQNCRILIPRDPPPFAQRSIELLGLADRVVETGNEDLRIERYWFAGPSMLSGCPDPLGVGWLRQQFMTGADRDRHRLIYIERKAETRNLTNAGEVRNWLTQRGWEVLEPGKLNLDEQIRHFQEARAVVAAHGAALTNLLWAAPSTHVLELMPSRRRNGCYAGISLVAGLSHRSLVCPSNRQGDIYVPLDTLAACLKRMELDG